MGGGGVGGGGGGGGGVGGNRTNSFLRNHSASNVLFGSQVREERGTNRT